MAIPARLQLSEGLWHGVSELNYSEDPAVENIFESRSALEVALDSTSAFATVSYTWVHEGIEQHGQLLIAGDVSSNFVTAGWSDSWHQSNAVMSLDGSGMAEDDEVSLTGSSERFQVRRADGLLFRCLGYGFDDVGRQPRLLSGARAVTQSR